MTNIVDLNTRARAIVDQVDALRPPAEAGKLYTREQVARYFHVNKRTLQRWEHEGIGPKVTRIGLAVYYRGESILKALEEGTAE